MLASQTRNEDLQAYTDLSESLLVVARLYKKDPTPERLEYITFTQKTLEWLKKRIETHDYTPDDELFTRLLKGTCTFTGESI